MADGARSKLRARYGGYAMVTGAARGIGRAFAEQLAGEGFGLLLVDQEADETRALAEELHAVHGVDAQTVIRDLSAPGLAEEARAWANAHDVGLLVNNAGTSLLDPFLDISLDQHEKTLDLNCRATLC